MLYLLALLTYETGSSAEKISNHVIHLEKQYTGTPLQFQHIACISPCNNLFAALAMLQE